MGDVSAMRKGEILTKKKAGEASIVREYSLHDGGERVSLAVYLLIWVGLGLSG